MNETLDAQLHQDSLEECNRMKRAMQHGKMKNTLKKNKDGHIQMNSKFGILLYFLYCVIAFNDLCILTPKIYLPMVKKLFQIFYL